MKKQTVFVQIILVALMSVLGIACASKNDGGFSTNDSGITPNSPQPSTTPTPTPTPGTGTDYFAGGSGASVPLNVNWADANQRSVWTTYVGSHPLNAPTNFRLYVDLNEVNGRAGGTVKIGYQDNGQLYTGVFSTQNPNGYNYNRVSYKNWYVGQSNSEFNQWFTYGGKRVWHGFFQDAYGAIIIVIDGGIDLGDGGGLTELTGRVYFKNFKTAPAPQYMGGSGENCWFLLPPSPYECGAFKVGERVVTTSALYPGDGYTLLSTFTGMNKASAIK